MAEEMQVEEGQKPISRNLIIAIVLVAVIVIIALISLPVLFLGTRFGLWDCAI